MTFKCDEKSRKALLKKTKSFLILHNIKMPKYRVERGHQRGRIKHNVFTTKWKKKKESLSKSLSWKYNEILSFFARSSFN